MIQQTNEMALHPLTKSHPLMTEEQYASFKEDIKAKGQLHPVILYRGKIVDGRHRLRALTELGISEIKTDTLPQNLTLKEVEGVVMSSENRRHQSPTQLAIKGYRLFKKGMKQPDAVTAAGCSLANLKRVVTIAKMKREDIIDLLERGIPYNLGTVKAPRPTSSLLAIINDLKVEQEFASGLRDNDFNPDKVKPTQSQEAFIANTLLMVNEWEDSIKKVLVSKLYASMTKED